MDGFSTEPPEEIIPRPPREHVAELAGELVDPSGAEGVLVEMERNALRGAGLDPSLSRQEALVWRDDVRLLSVLRGGDPTEHAGTATALVALRRAEETCRWARRVLPEGHEARSDLAAVEEHLSALIEGTAESGGLNEAIHVEDHFETTLRDLDDGDPLHE